MGSPEFTVIQLDLYTNLRDTLEMMSAALFGKKFLGATDGEGGSPSVVLSLADYVEKGSLSAEEAAALEYAVFGVTGFWQTLAPVVSFPPRSPGVVPVYRVNRIATRGAPALDQTIRWLRRQGVENPVVWNDSPTSSAPTALVTPDTVKEDSINAR